MTKRRRPDLGRSGHGLEAAREDLLSRGVPVSTIQHHDGGGFAEGSGGDWNSFVFLDDPDGNGWAVQQSPTVRPAAGYGAA